MEQRRIVFSAALYTAVILLLFPLFTNGQGSGCPNCPQNCVCPCEACGPCNAGQFWVSCTCCGAGCSTNSGVCSVGTDCTYCCQPSGGKLHCTYVGCAGQSCPGSYGPEQARGSTRASEVRLLNVALPASRPCNNPLSGQVEQPKCDNCTAHVINLGPNANGQMATLLAPRDVPLDFSALQMNLGESGGIQGGSYLLRNNSGAGLVTLVTSWNFEGINPASGGPNATDIIDSWASDAAFLAPGSEALEEIRFEIHTHSGEVVRRLTGTVVYAEFDDGTRVGPAAGTTAPRLREQRLKMLAAYKELLQMIQSGSDLKEIATYIQERPSLTWLNAVHGGEGLKGFVAEITKPRHLAP